MRHPATIALRDIPHCGPREFDFAARVLASHGQAPFDCGQTDRGLIRRCRDAGLIRQLASDPAFYTLTGAGFAIARAIAATATGA